MVTGKKPFNSDNEWEMMHMRVKCDIPDPATVLPELPDGLRRFILKACARFPGDRYMAIEQVLEDLGPLSREYGFPEMSRNSERQNISTIFLVYGDKHQSALKHLMEDLSSKAKKVGIKMKVSDFQT